MRWSVASFISLGLLTQVAIALVPRGDTGNTFQSDPPRTITVVVFQKDAEDKGSDYRYSANLNDIDPSGTATICCPVITCQPSETIIYVEPCLLDETPTTTTFIAEKAGKYTLGQLVAPCP